jgi:starch synthase
LRFRASSDADIFPELELPQSVFAVDGIEYYGDVSYLKGGLQLASVITTVSPTYAQEIRTPEFGMGLDGLINARAATFAWHCQWHRHQVWDPAN